jgi:hypothetical protein
VIKNLVDDVLPEFSGPGVEVEEDNDCYFDGRKVHFLEFPRAREDGLFEKIVFQKEFNKEWLVSFQMVTHYFAECPIPAFPFGCDAGLENLIRKSGLTVAANSWYKCGTDESDDGERLTPMKGAIIEYVQPTFERWAASLLGDPILQCAIRLYRTWPSDVEDVRGHLQEEIQATANRFPEMSTSRAVSKIVSQMVLRKAGNERWKWC